MDQKIEKILKKILKVVNKADLNVPEIITLIGRICLSVGASIAKRTEDPPTLAELTTTYHQSPTVDVALMLQGYQMFKWVESLKETKENKK